MSSLFTYLGFFLVSLSLESMFHGYEWSCHWFVWVAPLLVPLWLYPVVLRAWRLFFNYFASRYFMRHVGKLTDDNQKKVEKNYFIFCSHLTLPGSDGMWKKKRAGHFPPL